MMQASNYPIVKEVVLIGGGHAHALFLRRWAMKPVQGARITLINPDPTAPYTGMLPGFVAGHYARDELEIDLVRLARLAGARLILGAVSALGADAKTLAVAGRPAIPFDFASIDIGITSTIDNLHGFPENGIPAKPLGPFAAAWQTYVETGDTRPIAVIGGGVGGVELALAMQHRLQTLQRSPKISILESGTLLASLSPSTRSRLVMSLNNAGIDIRENATPTKLTDTGVVLDDGSRVEAGFTISAAGATPYPWLSETDLKLENGFIAVDETLRSVSHPAIYAVGDCAHLSHAPRPKAGVFAVRAAPVLYANIRADLLGEPHRSFRPQKRYLKLISLGGKSAVVDKYGISPSGGWAWTWKDWIDRRFMNRLNETPAPRAPASNGAVVAQAGDDISDQPMCGGCGSKVGATVLDRVLSRTDTLLSDDVVSGPGDDAALIRCGSQTLAITTDHLRVFWDDPWLMARIAAIHALGDVWAMGAQPQALLAQIILPRLSERLQEEWLAEILDGAMNVANACGASLAGGHTSQGAELTIGFTVTGKLTGTANTLDRARPGDALILTKPIGTGTILAAAMQGVARGSDVAETLARMSEIPMAAAGKLNEASPGAMTDVTGFGLAGHALRMAEASNASLEIDSTQVPLLPGARDLAARGIASTLAPANEAALGTAPPDTPEGRLMIDPQTAGGFLASVAPEIAQEIVDSIDGAAVIGRVLPRGPVGLAIL